MYKLENGNVVKIVNTKHERDKLISKGFKEVIETEIKEKELEKLTVKELKELAKEKNIEGYNDMKKEDLIMALKEDGE